MNKNIVEVLIGAMVLVVAAVFLVFAYKSADLKKVRGYEVVADFSRIDGLKKGNDVMISGVKVGSVSDLVLNTQSFLATVKLSIDPSVKLPKDTVASISSESLFGGKYISLEPGGDEEIIQAGGKIEFTQATPGLEQLLGQVIFSLTSKDSEEEKGSENKDAK